MQPKRQQITGRGNPPRSLKAELGTTYRDETSGRRWVMADHGWELPVSLQIDALISHKGRWNAAARAEGLSLEQWVTRTLNEAAAKYPITAKR